MSVKNPIIAITGSSGAGTTSVTRTFESIFRREAALQSLRRRRESFRRAGKPLSRLRGVRHRRESEVPAQRPGGGRVQTGERHVHPMADATRERTSVL